MRTSRLSRARRMSATATVAVLVGLGPIASAAAVSQGPGYGGDAGQLSVSWVRESTANVPPAEPAPAPSTAVPSGPALSDPAPSAPAPSAPSPSADAPSAVQDSPVAPAAPAAPPTDSATGGGATPVAMPAGGAARGIGAVVRPRTSDPQLAPDGLALVVRGLGFRGKSVIEVRIGSGEPIITRADSAGALAVALDPQSVGTAQPGVSVMAVGRNQSGTAITLFGSIPPEADGSGPMSLVPWAVGAIGLGGLAVWMRRRHGRPIAEPGAASPID